MSQGSSLSWPEKTLRKEVPSRRVTMMDMLVQQAEEVQFIVLWYKKEGFMAPERERAENS